ncbi:MAG: hypothetical protein UY71_C0019G0002 [Parcubacteria group bacterium GW2011_GWB1_52_7]|nr:MAG: hypothetical protein UY71_C0019G0002 [Parcubacteria group bacterium GW2011_GWB1_52_7]
MIELVRGKPANLLRTNFAAVAELADLPTGRQARWTQNICTLFTLFQV